MITIEPLEVDKSNEWLYNAITQGLKECLTAPILTHLPFPNEDEKRADMIIKNFSREDCPAIVLIVNPTRFIQLVLPEDEVIISILYRYNRDIHIEVILNKLIHHGK